jgi:L-amino acid N-acyltransferase YncA
VIKHRVQQDYKPYLVKIDAKGKITGNISLSEVDLDEVFDIKSDHNGNIYLTGEGKSEAKPVLVKLNNTGQLQWQQMYEGEPGSYRAYSIALDQDNGFVLVGRTHNASGFLIKTDASGNVKWKKIFSGIEKAGFKKVIVTENGYVLAGVTLTGNKNKAYCLYVNRNGDL